MMDSIQKSHNIVLDSTNCSEPKKEGEVNNSGEKFFERLRDALSVRAKNILLDNEIYHLGDFLHFISSGNNQFVNFRNCGKKTVKELEELTSLLLRYVNDPSSIVKIPIDELDISGRTLNSLKSAHIETLGELASFEKADIRKFHGLGEKSLQEIENAVIKKGLWFGFDIGTLSQGNDTKPQVILDDNTTTSGGEECEQNEIVDNPKLNIPIEDLGFSYRAYNCLKTAEIETLGELVALKKEELFNFRNLGRKSIQEIEEIVISKGLQFGMDMRNYFKAKSIKSQALESLLSNSAFDNLSRVDLDYIYAFKEKYSRFPLIFLLCKSLNCLTNREQTVVKMAWGLKSLSFKSSYRELPEFSAWSVDPSPPLSINEIANELDLTGVRTRQIYEKANKRMKSSLKHIFLHEDWGIYGVEHKQFLFPGVLNTSRIIEERDFLIAYIQKHWNSVVGFYRFMEDVPCVSENHLFLVLFLRGMNPLGMNQKKKELLTQHLTTRPIIPDFFVNNRLKKYNYNKAVKEVCRLQEAKKTENIFIPIGSYFIDNENYWSGIKPTAIEKDNVQFLLIWLFQTLCEAKIENNSVLFKANKADYGNILYEILVNEGTRLSRDELFGRLKETCDKMGLRCNLSNSSQITRFLANDLRIISYGKSSYWGLREWGESYGSIRELALHFVMKSKEPIQIDDLTKLIIESRPDSNEKSISSIIRQTTTMGELLLFFGDYIGCPDRKYEKEYIIMPQTFDDWLNAFYNYVVKNKRFPYSNQDGFEGYLYRWHFKAKQLTDLSPEEILKIDALEKELAYYPHNMTEYTFLHNCNLYKKFVEGNNRMLEETDDSELYKWFYSASLNYSTYNDNRNKYFSQLLQYLSSKLY